MQQKTPTFVTGKGQYDTRKHADQPYETVSGADILKLVNKPPNVPKESAQWFIPSTYAEHDARSHDAQRKYGVFRWLTLDVDVNNLTLNAVDDTLSDVIGAASRFIYSSRSATATDRKWRALVPLKTTIMGLDFSDTQSAFFDLLEQASNGALIPDRALARPAQLVYLPNKGDFYETIASRTDILDLSPDHAIIRYRDQQRDKLKKAEAEANFARNRRIAERDAKIQSGKVSPVGLFNNAHTVADLLARYGYKQLGSSCHWKSPIQSSGSYATKDYGDYWISLSNSDANAGIGAGTVGGHRHGDAFDLFCHFEHGGDFSAAVKAYADEAGMNRQSEAMPKANHLSDFKIEPPLSTQKAQVEAKRKAKINRFLEGVFAASDLEGQNVPPRNWHVQDLIPCETVTLFSGDGGTGKSLVALQLAVSTALARPWLRMPVKEGNALYLSAEDDKDELHRRLADIAQAEGVEVSELQNLKCRSLAGEDALLATLNKGGALEPTPLLDAIDDLLKRDQPDLLVLDTLADYFPGNENDRAQARQFVGMLRGLAIRHRCAVFMLAHPSLTGLNSGTGTSGSTGWNNSVRSRLYLSRVVQDGYEANPDARVLRNMKSNYARTGAEIALTWQNGVFVADAPISGLDRMAASAKAERLFLTFLRQFEEQGRKVNHAGGQTYAPKVFAAHPDAEGVNKRGFTQAMESLLATGKVKISQDGPPSKRRQFLVVAE